MGLSQTLQTQTAENWLKIGLKKVFLLIFKAVDCLNSAAAENLWEHQFISGGLLFLQ